MKKRKLLKPITLLLMLTIILYFASVLEVAESEPTTWVVPIDYSTIQAAIDAANPDDTIIVKNGVYYENVSVDKRLTLLGENRSYTIINGSGLEQARPLVHITASNVSFVGFTVTRSHPGNTGLLVSGSQYCQIHNNIVSFSGSRGIVFYGGGQNEAIGNVVYNSSNYGGIEAIFGVNNTIANNVVYLNEWGIATNMSSFNLIANNVAVSNNHGVHIDWGSIGNVVQDNTIEGSAADGVSIMNHANGTVIVNNGISGGYTGIRIQDSYSLTIVGNYLVSNERGIDITSSQYSHIYHNNFINNTDTVDPGLSSANFWDNGYPSGGNYWSDFNVTDLYSGPFQNLTGSDGIGDFPYLMSIQPLIRDLYPLMGSFGRLTPRGLDITVFPMENVALVFPNVSAPGFTDAFQFDFGPQPPPDYTIERFFEIICNASYSGNITMRIAYDDSNMTEEDEAKLRLVLFSYTVPGDMDWDYDVDIYDIVRLCGAYGSSLGEPRFLPECDLDEDGDIDIYDVVIAASNYLESIPAEDRYLDITAAVNVDSNIIYGEAPHLSIFGVTREA